MDLQRLTWAWARLRSMPPAELPHRVREAARRAADRRGATRRAWESLPDDVFDGPAPGWPVDRDALAAVLRRDAVLADARAIVRGDYTTLGVTRPAGSRRAWDLLWRPEPKHGWEHLRLQHLVVLGCAGLLADDEARRIAAEDLVAWVGEAPFEGPAWAAGIECAARLVSMLFVVGLVGADAFTPAESRAIRRSLVAHGLWLARYPSLHSSANNHRMAEVCGLAVLDALAPHLAAVVPGAARARRDVAREAKAQLLPDGVGAEMAVAYQAYTMEWLLFARRAALLAGRPLDAIVDERLVAGATFLRALADASGGVPAIGDDDEGVVFRERLDVHDHLRSVVGAVAATFDRPDLALPGTAYDARAVVLGGQAVVPCGAPRSRVFRDGGLTVLRDGDGARERVVVFDHGPLGFLGIAAHGHADALAIWLSVGGRAVLVDHGTSTYNADPALRAAVRATRSHNTVTVDGRSQSTPTGPFNWGDRAAAHLAEVDPPRLVAAWHDGYRDRGVVHRRRVELGPDALAVTDELLGQGRHHLSWCWQLAPGLGVRKDGAAFDVGGLVTVTTDGPALAVTEGGGGPGAGWVAARFGEEVPAPALVGTATLDLPVRVTTRFTFPGAIP